MDSFIKYFGGKSILANNIVDLMPPHRTYIEPFCGASWVLFNKPPSNIEVINDIDNDLINLYLIIQNNLDDFIQYLDKIPISEYLFNTMSKGIPYRSPRYTVNPGKEGIPVKDLNHDISRACSTYYILMNSFNGNISNPPSFAIKNNARSSFMKFYNTDWEMVRDRLKPVTILTRDYSEIIKKFDGPESLFYLDPPYFVATNETRYYRYTFTGQDHDRLQVYLSDIRGKFILSYDNCQEVRELYQDFNIRIMSDTELLIYNFEPSEVPYYCREGIPKPDRGPSQGAWHIPNCSYCGSRNIQKLYRRDTLDGNKRTFKHKGFTCNDCMGVFNA